MDSDYYYYEFIKYSYYGMNIELDVTYKVLRDTMLKFRYTMWKNLKIFLIKGLTRFGLYVKIDLEIEREIKLRVGMQTISKRSVKSWSSDIVGSNPILPIKGDYTVGVAVQTVNLVHLRARVVRLHHLPLLAMIKELSHVGYKRCSCRKTHMWALANVL